MTDKTTADLTAITASYLNWLGKTVGPSGIAAADVTLSNLLPFAPHITRMDVHPSAGPQPVRFRFKMVGTHVDAWYLEPVTGHWLDELELGDWGAHWLNEYESVATKQEIRMGRAPIEWQGREHVEIEYVFAPVLSTDGTVQEVLGHVHFHHVSNTEKVPTPLPFGPEGPHSVFFDHSKSAEEATA